MREAIGATWIMGIVIAFIALFSGFLAFSINYSKAFKVKNGIVERIEKYGGVSEEAKEDITTFLKGIGYNAIGSCDKLLTDDNLSFAGFRIDEGTTAHPSKKDKYNFCIQKINSNSATGDMITAYYKVYVFFSLSIPVIQDFTKFYVTGETKNIYFPKDGSTFGGK